MPSFPGRVVALVVCLAGVPVLLALADPGPDRLPAGSGIRFQPPSMLSEYRWPIAASIVIIALQAGIIAALLLARRRRRQAEEETLHLRRELAHAGRVSAVGQLASSLAHELNQPLGAILRNAEAAEIYLNADPPNLDEVRAILADIRQDDLRAGGVIDEVRSLLRRPGPDLAPLDLRGVVDAVASLTRPDAQSRGVEMAVEIDPGLPAVAGNSVQLQQVLLNLVLNGMEAMEQTPLDRRRLRVRVRPVDGAHVEMAVTDSGPGIPEPEKGRLFENFYTTKTTGMGMGLAICRRIVESHGGRIEAGNERDGGATLRVTLPAQGASA
jgi:two-component system sensor kinase FixL